MKEELLRAYINGKMELIGMNKDAAEYLHACRLLGAKEDVMLSMDLGMLESIIKHEIAKELNRRGLK